MLCVNFKIPGFILNMFFNFLAKKKKKKKAPMEVVSSWVGTLSSFIQYIAPFLCVVEVEKCLSLKH